MENMWGKPKIRVMAQNWTSLPRINEQKDCLLLEYPHIYTPIVKDVPPHEKKLLHLDFSFKYNKYIAKQPYLV